ncbi:MAG: DinB family protein [Dehalococcoidia bacterium]|nr:DinB family protein [Dehalococcoidia bacterium]
MEAALESQAEPIRARLVATAAKEWFELWPAVMAARTGLVQALAAIPEALAHERPGSGEGESAWSAYEVARHVLAYTRNVTDIITATAVGQSAAKDPRGALAPDPSLSLRDLRRLIVDESASLAALHLTLPSQPDVGVTVDHPLFGPLHARAWYAFLEVHDSDHARQLRALAAERRA